jgi:hypothetical protein
MTEWDDALKHQFQKTKTPDMKMLERAIHTEINRVQTQKRIRTMAARLIIILLISLVTIANYYIFKSVVAPFSPTERLGFWLIFAIISLAMGAGLWACGAYILKRRQA